jgi:hypothetical protein
MHYSKIIVQHRSGAKAKRVRVALSIQGIISGGQSESVLTDDYGVALVPHQGKGRAKILVKNISRGEMVCPGETVVFI